MKTRRKTPCVRFPFFTRNVAVNVSLQLLSHFFLVLFTDACSLIEGDDLLCTFNLLQKDYNLFFSTVLDLFLENHMLIFHIKSSMVFSVSSCTYQKNHFSYIISYTLFYTFTGDYSYSSGFLIILLKIFKSNIASVRPRTAVTLRFGFTFL